MRLFVGLNINDELRKILDGIHNVLNEHTTILKVVPPRDYHVTLKFLGECRAGLADDIKKSFHTIFKPTREDEFLFALKGVGVFPDLNNATVIWCGIDSYDKKIFELYEMVENFFQKLGFERESRSFFPHLTIARVRKGMKLIMPLRKFLQENEQTVFAESKFISLALFSSNLTPNGPIYKIEEEIVL